MPRTSLGGVVIEQEQERDDIKEVEEEEKKDFILTDEKLKKMLKHPYADHLYVDNNDWEIEQQRLQEIHREAKKKKDIKEKLPTSPPLLNPLPQKSILPRWLNFVPSNDALAAGLGTVTGYGLWATSVLWGYYKDNTLEEHRVKQKYYATEDNRRIKKTFESTFYPAERSGWVARLESTNKSGFEGVSRNPVAKSNRYYKKETSFLPYSDNSKLGEFRKQTPHTGFCEGVTEEVTNYEVVGGVEKIEKTREVLKHVAKKFDPSSLLPSNMKLAGQWGGFIGSAIYLGMKIWRKKQVIKEKSAAPLAAAAPYIAACRLLGLPLKCDLVIVTASFAGAETSTWLVDYVQNTDFIMRIAHPNIDLVLSIGELNIRPIDPSTNPLARRWQAGINLLLLQEIPNFNHFKKAFASHDELMHYLGGIVLETKDTEEEAMRTGWANLSLLKRMGMPHMQVWEFGGNGGNEIRGGKLYNIANYILTINPNGFMCRYIGGHIGIILTILVFLFITKKTTQYTTETLPQAVASGAIAFTKTLLPSTSSSSTTLPPLKKQKKEGGIFMWFFVIISLGFLWWLIGGQRKRRRS